ncbi:MAG: co-chaperone GroES [Candidatus Nanopelagicales bacterium]|nr:co-chaperone GroES [Candidatus Nanopelagicales bacterium]
MPQTPPTAGSPALAGPDLTPTADGSVPIKLLHDRLLVHVDAPDGERRSGGGILIPATAAVGKRLTWARAVAAGPLVRSVEVGDLVLFEPEERAEVELRGVPYLLLRERDIHAVAAARVAEAGTGLYL